MNKNQRRESPFKGAQRWTWNTKYFKPTISNMLKVSKETFKGRYEIMSHEIKNIIKIFQ